MQVLEGKALAWNNVIMLVIRHGLNQVILSMEGKALLWSES
jgi:hypothetical protein